MISDARYHEPEKKKYWSFGVELRLTKNTSNNGLKYITLFVTNNHTNIILLTVPHWYDLHAFSCVNNKVKNFNRKLMKYMNPDTHISILEVYHNKEYFTTLGLHLNGLGREVICNWNVSTAQEILQLEKVKPISMYWKVDNTNLNSIDIQSVPGGTCQTSGECSLC